MIKKGEEDVQIVVRLRRTFWHDNNGAYQRASLCYLKRHTYGFNFFEEDCSNSDAKDVIVRIINLEKCKDGIYQLVTCNERKDWETGHVEEWDYKLLPFDLTKK